MDTMDTIILIYVFLAGASIGSFANVCIARIPRQLSIVKPPSHCPKCKTPLKVLDNIPLLSFILLKGRCRTCQKNISLRYPMVELLTGLLYFSLYIKFEFPVFLIFALLATALVIIAFIDIDYQIIPNIITFPGIPLGLISTYFFLPHSILNAIIGLLGGGGLLLLMAIIYPGGMGGGDIKMVAMLGAFLGWQKVFLTIFIGSLIGSIIGIALMLIKKWGRKTKIPFGPYLALGALLSIFFGDALIEYYLKLTF
jgi:leader peptidase (prepilin peptidase)/N-methyltransferase